MIVTETPTHNSKGGVREKLKGSLVTRRSVTVVVLRNHTRVNDPYTSGSSHNGPVSIVSILVI